jgi:hypothetical protein
VLNVENDAGKVNEEVYGRDIHTLCKFYKLHINLEKKVLVVLVVLKSEASI